MISPMARAPERSRHYMFGPDLLVAPVMVAGVLSRGFSGRDPVVELERGVCAPFSYVAREPYSADRRIVQQKSVAAIRKREAR